MRTNPTPKIKDKYRELANKQVSINTFITSSASAR